jgi:hypothetical protein
LLAIDKSEARGRCCAAGCAYKGIEKVIAATSVTGQHDLKRFGDLAMLKGFRWRL